MLVAVFALLYGPALFLLCFMCVSVSSVFLDWRFLKGRDLILYISHHISCTVSYVDRRMDGWMDGKREGGKGGKNEGRHGKEQ